VNLLPKQIIRQRQICRNNFRDSNRHQVCNCCSKIFYTYSVVTLMICPSTKLHFGYSLAILTKLKVIENSVRTHSFYFTFCHSTILTKLADFFNICYRMSLQSLNFNATSVAPTCEFTRLPFNNGCRKFKKNGAVTSSKTRKVQSTFQDNKSAGLKVEVGATHEHACTHARTHTA
jgi:hypothetical protein